MSRKNLIYFALEIIKFMSELNQGKKSPLTEPATNSYVKLGKTNKPKSRVWRLG
jgi:hypothetical protein